MSIRETAIAKLQQLPESLLQEVSDFIDFVAHKHQFEMGDRETQNDTAKAWEEWFEAVDRLDIISSATANSYQQLLLDKYRQQGLDL